MSEYGITHGQLERAAYDDDAYTFFEDVDIGNVKVMNRIIKNCIRYGAYVTFEKFMRRGYAISRICLFYLIKYSHPLPYIQVLCDSGLMFDDVLVAPLIKRRQIASLACIVHRRRLEPRLIEKYAILQELLSLDPECTGFMWQSDIQSIKYMLPNTWKKFDFVLDSEPGKNMSVVDFAHHPRIFASFCHYAITHYTYVVFTRYVWKGNIFHRLMRLANCKGSFSPQNSHINNYEWYRNSSGRSGSRKHGFGIHVCQEMWDNVLHWREHKSFYEKLKLNTE
jgi:hypothetical protein